MFCSTWRGRREDQRHVGGQRREDLSDDTEERPCFVALPRGRSEMPEIEVGRLVGTGEISSALLVLVDVGKQVIMHTKCIML